MSTYLSWFNCFYCCFHYFILSNLSNSPLTKVVSFCHVIPIIFFMHNLLVIFSYSCPVFFDKAKFAVFCFFDIFFMFYGEFHKLRNVIFFLSILFIFSFLVPTTILVQFFKYFLFPSDEFIHILFYAALFLDLLIYHH